MGSHTFTTTENLATPQRCKAELTWVVVTSQESLPAKDSHVSLGNWLQISVSVIKECIWLWYGHLQANGINLGKDRILFWGHKFPPIERTPSNFVIKLTTLKCETCFSTIAPNNTLSKKMKYFNQKNEQNILRLLFGNIHSWHHQQHQSIADEKY